MKRAENEWHNLQTALTQTELDIAENDLFTIDCYPADGIWAVIKFTSEGLRTKREN